MTATMEQVGQPKAVITSIKERHACWYVEGKVNVRGEWLTAKFTAFKPDVAHMGESEFLQFCVNNLPLVTEDKQWAPDGRQLVA